MLIHRFKVTYPFILCILSSINVEPTGVTKLFCDRRKITWESVNKIPSHPLTSITQGPKYAVTSNFINSIQVDICFYHCFSRYCFIDQVFLSCMEFILKDP